MVHGLVAGRHAELAIDRADLRVDRVARDEQPVGDVADGEVGLQVGQQPQLGGGER